SQKDRLSLAWRERGAKMASKRKTGGKGKSRGKVRVKARAAKKPAAKKSPIKKIAPKKAPAKKAARALLVHPRKRGRGRPMPPRPLKIGASPYDTGLDRNAANFQPLTPLTHLERAATTYPETIAVIHGQARLSYAQFYA